MKGERLAEVRKDHGDTQETLADQLSVVKHTVASWEQGKSEPSHEMLVKICRLYGISSDYLLGLSNIDPAYVQRRRLEKLTQQELEMLDKFERFLLWSRSKEKNPPA